jgi:hypothetical protein
VPSAARHDDGAETPCQRLGTMNQEQFTGVVRHVLGAVGAYVVAKGITDESTMIQATGAIATLAAVVWSIIEKRNRR